MMTIFARLLTGMALTSALAFCQNFAAPQNPPQSAPPSTGAELGVDLSGLQDMLRTADSFNSAVKDMHLENRFQESQSGPSAPATQRDPKRTMAMIGAGAGIGVALASMTGDRKAVMYGAIAGGVGGLIIDQIMRNRARKAELAVMDPRTIQGAPLPDDHQLKTREPLASPAK
jgi:hypothetical protein